MIFQERVKGYLMTEIREYTLQDIVGMATVWNEVVDEGVAFPQEELLDECSAVEFFASQTYCGVALLDGCVIGLYILHPNNVGRCAHICNASYAVCTAARGRGVGKRLVEDSMDQGKRLGFRVLQFNAVVASNAGARHLYEKLGFVQLGVIPGGFRMPDGSYADICPYYHEL